MRKLTRLFWRNSQPEACLLKIRTTKEQSAYAIRTRHVTKKIAAKPKYFLFLLILLFGQLLKVFENVLFNIASEASYIYILSGQKFTKNATKMVDFENLKLMVKQCYQTGHF